MLEVLGEPDCSGQPAGDTSSPYEDTIRGSTPRLVLKEGAGFSTTWTEDQLGLVPSGDPAAPSLSCVQAGPAACSVPMDHTPSGSRPGCRTRPGSSRAILKGTRDCLMLGSGRAGAICGQNKGVPSLTVLPHQPTTGTRASWEPLQRLAYGPGGGSSLFPTRPLGLTSFPAIGGTCPPGRRTTCSFPQAQVPLVPRVGPGPCGQKRSPPRPGPLWQGPWRLSWAPGAPTKAPTLFLTHGGLLPRMKPTKS